MKTLNLTRRNERGKLLSRKCGLKLFSAGLVTLSLLIGGGFLIGQHQPALAATVTANDFTSLQSAIAAAPNDGTNYDIEITGDITITATLTLATNQNISLHSDGTVRTLLRAPGYTGAFITSPATTQATSALTLTNLILDGNKANVTATAPMILFSNGGKATLNIGDGAVLRNNAMTSGYGGAVLSYSNTNIYGDAIFENNSSQYGGALAFRSSASAAPYTVNVYDNVKIRGNTSTSAGGGMMAWGQVATIKVNVYGRTTFSGNTGPVPGMVGIGIVDVDIYGDALFTGNINNSSTTGNGTVAVYNNNATERPLHASVRDNVVIQNNTNARQVGGLYLQAVECEVAGNVEISGNAAAAGIGGLFINGCDTATLTGDVVVKDNTTGAHTGGVFIQNSPTTISGNFKILNNEATYIGGLYIAASQVMISDNVEISGNISNGRMLADDAQGGGGGVVIANAASTLTIIDNVKISGNQALGGGGGGILIWRNTAGLPTVTISGAVQITDNYAAGDGGGIMIEPQQLQPVTAADYEKLVVGPDVVFARNMAQAAYQIDPADIPMHDVQIATHSFTTPFAYGYNNYDINYTGGTQVYRVLFETNGGSAIKGQLVPVGGVAVRPSDPVRDGYRFIGWYLEDELYDFGTVLTGDVQLVARWEAPSWPIVPDAPNTGLSRMSASATMASPGLVVIIAGTGVVLVGRKLALGRK